MLECCTQCRCLLRTDEQDRGFPEVSRCLDRDPSLGEVRQCSALRASRAGVVVGDGLSQAECRQAEFYPTALVVGWTFVGDRDCDYVLDAHMCLVWFGLWSLWTPCCTPEEDADGRSVEAPHVVLIERRADPRPFAGAILRELGDPAFGSGDCQHRIDCGAFVGER